MEFEKRLKQLNSQQRQAVSHSSGPLLVVAGAGTGKTRVIIEKINKLLADGVAPSSILAVTFTEKAASEMLDRVLASQKGFLPDLLIMTFNGFGNMVLHEYGLDFGLSSNFRLLGPQAQIVFFRERIDEFELDYFLPLASSPDGIIEDILSLFSRLKQHIIDPETYQAFADKLPDNDEAEKLDKKKHRELAKAYSTYVRLCRSENVIDYDDQIYLCVRLLEERPNVRAKLQKRFHMLFIDEFQDTNPMQSRFIDLIVNEHENLVVVGDDDQSIYGFRGATLQNILSFKDRYPKTSEVALTQNYRSHQSILDSAYKLIGHNNPNRLEASLGLNKRLISNEPGNEPFLKRFEDSDQEMYWLAEDVAKRIEAGENPGSIAVLTRGNRTAARVHDALTLAGVEHRVVGLGQDLYSTPIARMLLELIRTIAEPENNTSLHHTLSSELFGISNNLIAPLASRAKYEHVKLEELLAEDARPEVTSALQMIASWREAAATASVRIVLWEAINQSGYFDRLKSSAPGSDEVARSIHNLGQFFHSLREFESIAIQPTTSQYLVSLPALIAAGENTNDDTLDITSDEVIVTTVHKAKGLEWDSVYIPIVNEQSFPIWPRGKGLQVPDALRRTSESPADEHYAEERRLMYVAITRARRNLVISFSDKSRSGSKLKPSRFIDEMFGADTAESSEIIDASEAAQPKLDIPIEKSAKLSVPREIYDGKLVRLSVSQAAVLLDCPLNFYYKFVMKAPERPTPSTDYGSYLHGFFESINKDQKNGSLKPLKHYIEQLEAGWQRSGYVSKATQEKAYQQAHETLTNFYRQTTDNAPPIEVEKSFEVELRPEGVLLRGKVDAVLDREGIEIRDYKTGNKVRDEATANRRAGGSSQLTMYALAWQIEQGEIPARLSLEFVDTGYVGSVKKTQRGIDGLRSRLGKAVENLKDNHFPPGSKHDYCIHP